MARSSIGALLGLAVLGCHPPISIDEVVMLEIPPSDRSFGDLDLLPVAEECPPDEEALLRSFRPPLPEALSDALLRSLRQTQAFSRVTRGERTGNARYSLEVVVRHVEEIVFIQRVTVATHARLRDANGRALLLDESIETKGKNFAQALGANVFRVVEAVLEVLKEDPDFARPTAPLPGPRAAATRDAASRPWRP